MISFELFKKCIDECKHYAKVNEAVYEASNMSIQLNSIYYRPSNFTSPEDFIVSLLEALCLDKSEWISYWCFEQDFGTKLKIDDVQVNGKPYDLRSIEHLYDLVKENYDIYIKNGEGTNK